MMLILTRKLNGLINIGDNVTVKIIKVMDGKIQIGIEAPKDMKIVRSEIYEQNQPNKENSK